MTRLAFLSPHEADVEPLSPLRRVRGPFVDVSQLGKLEVHGDVDGLPLGPGRVLVVVDGAVHDAVVTLSPFYDPEGALLRS